MKRMIGLLLLIPVMLLAAHAENSAELTFSSFEGGGAEYWVEIGDPTIVNCEVRRAYDSDEEPLPPGSGYTETFAFQGMNPGMTTITIHSGSALVGNSSTVYTTVVDEELHVSLHLEEREESPAPAFQAVPVPKNASIAGTYRYEGEGFGGDFTISLNADGTYTFYEGPLSSYMGMGTWSVVDDVVRMTEGDAGFDLSFTFGVEEDALIYRSAGSNAFPYVALTDGARFIPMEDDLG